MSARGPIIFNSQSRNTGDANRKFNTGTEGAQVMQRFANSQVAAEANCSGQGVRRAAARLGLGTPNALGQLEYTLDDVTKIKREIARTKGSGARREPIARRA